MSILTKVSAVLLSVFSLLLAGMFVVFVGNTDNYKKLYEDQLGLYATLQQEMTTKDEQFNLQVENIGKLEAQLAQDVQDANAKNNELSQELARTKRDYMVSQANADRWKGVMEGLQQSVRNLQASLKETQTQLDAAREMGIKDQAKLAEITADLYDKIVQVLSLEAERRRLLEKIESVKTAPVRDATPVTPMPHRAARPARVTAPSKSVIRGLVLDISRNLAKLSVGSADGVTKGMTFHVYRGDSFICDVIITNVDVNQCAGTLDLVQQQPQINDTASTQ